MRKDTINNPRVCPVCGKEFHVSPSRLRNGRGHFCSKACYRSNESRVRTICPICGTEFEDFVSNHRTYCSVTCVGLSRRHTTESFWDLVDQTGGPEACWPWRGSCDPYGRISIADRSEDAHVIAYTLVNGPIPEDRPFVCHTCDNPPCCNPAHLYAGTPRDNVMDMYHRSRRVVPGGSAHWNAKFTDDEIRAIRNAREHGRTLADIGRQFDVSYRTVSKIVRRERYKDVH